MHEGGKRMTAYTMADYFEAMTTIENVCAYLRSQWSNSLPRDEAQANADARRMLVQEGIRLYNIAALTFRPEAPELITQQVLGEALRKAREGKRTDHEGNSYHHDHRCRRRQPNRGRR